MSNSNRAPLDDRIARIIDAFGIDGDDRRACSFAFSSRTPPAGWKAFTFELPLTFFYVDAPGGNITQVRSLSSGIGKENFILLALLGNRVVIVFRRYKKGENTPLLLPLRREEEIERVVNTVRRFNFISDELSAHSSLHSVVDLLKAGAERYFTNRGLFSTYFLKERLSGCLSERKRNPRREAREFLKKFWGEFPSTAEKSVQVLERIGYQVEALDRPGYPEYALRSHGRILDLSCVVATVEALDIKTGERAAPSYQAVSALRRSNWVILTNGRLWRLYSGRVSSPSTNYFEVDLDGVASETDTRLVYFMSLFSSSSFTLREEATDIDLVYEGGIKHAQEVEADLKNKLFDGELFLSLVKSVIDYSSDRTYSQLELDDGKTLALKLLYRLLFILYAESRGLLPVENDRYQQFSLEYLRPRLGSFEKEPDESSVWQILKILFSMISKGDVESNLPQYNGGLFEEDTHLDTVIVKNKFIVPALLDLMESGGRGIDYQNLGVRHLGSLYEALLEYSVRQAKEALVIYKDEILDAKYAQDLKKKPMGFVDSGGLYLTVKGLARKGTGSYYTPDEVVTFLVKKGLETQFQARKEKFKADIRLLPSHSKPRDLELEEECTEDLLGLRVVDPAMGSGHFLVAVVNEITRWVISLLEEYPYAPLMREIEESRKSIIEEQRKRGIRIDEGLLTDDVILKRMVMKRCIYGVDINPLAVELAKVSLWLDSFTIGTPLTFLDHHIRCGDSLIGSWRSKIKPMVYQTTLDRLNGEIDDARKSLIEDVIMPPDLTVRQLLQSREVYETVREKTKPLGIVLDIFCVKVVLPDLGKKIPANLGLIEETLRKKERPEWWAFVEEALEVARKYKFFHWELEFPDAFNKERWGFDLIVMNPPWEVLKPEDDDFFSVYRPRIRKIRSKPEKNKIFNELLKDDTISNAYNEYRKAIEDRVRFFKESKLYVRRGRGDTNYWKLFLERAMNLVNEDGGYALVIPSGIVTDQGGKQLRESLFEGRIRAMYEFENRKGIFQDVHRSYKFVLLVADKTSPTESFPAAFYLHDIDSLKGKVEQEKFINVSIDFIKKASPESLSILEARSQGELEILKEVYDKHPLMLSPKRGKHVSLVREDLALTSDMKRGWQIYEGKNFHQFIIDFYKPDYAISPTEGLRRTSKHREYRSFNRHIHEIPRLAFRGVSSSTNVRTMIAVILPPKTFVARKATLVFARDSNGQLILGDEYYSYIAYLAGIFNSMVFDFLIRKRISMNVNFFFVYQTPLPLFYQNKISEQITNISTRLSSIDDRYKEFANSLNVEYGPLNMKEYIEYTAQLNALVAKHYSLNKDQLEIILQSFEGFEEDDNLINMKDVKWDDSLIRKFNGEVRKRVLSCFEKIKTQDYGVKPL